MSPPWTRIAGHVESPAAPPAADVDRFWYGVAQPLVGLRLLVADAELRRLAAWPILGVLVLAALLAWFFIARRKKQEEARTEASHLRERAQDGETYVTGAEDRARELREKAQDAEQRAQRLQAEADEATRVAREHRDRVTDDYLRADDIDPDARH